MQRYGPLLIVALLVAAIAGYLFGFIPGDRFTGLLGLVGGTAGGFAIRHQGIPDPAPSVDAGPIGEVVSTVGKVP